MSGFAEKFNIQNFVNAARSSVYYIYIYGMSEFEEKLNIRDCVNSTENSVH